ncbi:hypothetical protein HAX54_048816, partial [Datura stramonium]|nr:hypothetical protein [Datura stramonium]
IQKDSQARVQLLVRGWMEECLNTTLYRSYLDELKGRDRGSASVINIVIICGRHISSKVHQISLEFQW